MITKFSRVLGLVIGALGVTSAAWSQSVLKDMHPGSIAGANGFSAKMGGNGSNGVGFAFGDGIVDGTWAVGHAIKWNNGVATDVHPGAMLGFDAFSIGTGYSSVGDTSVGFGAGSNTWWQAHALKWVGNTAYDINPVNILGDLSQFSYSVAQGVDPDSGNRIVGFGSSYIAPQAANGYASVLFNPIALRWDNGVARVLPVTGLAPSGYSVTYAEAAAINWNFTAGYGYFKNNTTGNGYLSAILWNGTTPRRLSSSPSKALGVHGVTVVGEVNNWATQWTTDFSGRPTAQNNLHMETVLGSGSNSLANATNGVLSVGSGQGAAISGTTHALAWQNGYIYDIHALMGWGAGDSEAYGVDDNGNISGYYTAADGQAHSFNIQFAADPTKGYVVTPTGRSKRQLNIVQWMLANARQLPAGSVPTGTVTTNSLPEPSTLALLGLGIVPLVLRRRRK